MQKVSTLAGTIIIVAVAVILLGALFAYQYFDKYPFKTGPLIINETNQTADWKTYKSDQYGFEFKYPQAVSIATGISPEFNKGLLTIAFQYKVGLYSFWFYVVDVGDKNTLASLINPDKILETEIKKQDCPAQVILAIM